MSSMMLIHVGLRLCSFWANIEVEFDIEAPHFHDSFRSPGARLWLVA